IDLRPGNPPRYVRDAQPQPRQSVAMEFVDDSTGGRAVIAPDVAEITPELQAAMSRADAVFFDGTFWSENELTQIEPSARSASEMGHLPISNGSLSALAEFPARHRTFIHINNTNPILASDSPERHEVEKRGLTVGEDGMEFQL